jgi:hypothetical protein
MGFNNDRPQVSFVLSSQTLIQGQVLFDILFDEHLKDLSKYKVLVLADQECLDDGKIALIESFVYGGGGLVATEHSSLYTELRLRRPDFGLKKLFGVTAPPWKGRGVAEKPMNGGAVRNQFGAGRVVYLPEMIPTIEKPPAVAMTSEYWRLPSNWRELVEAVRWAAGGQLSLNIEAPLTVIPQVTAQRQEGKLLVHFLNYDGLRTPLVENITTDLRLLDGMQVKEVSLLTPDEPGITKLNYTSGSRRVKFSIPHLETYSLVTVQLT